MISRHDLEPSVTVGQHSPKRESRRLALLKRMGLFSDKISVRITRAMSVESLCEAYRLVHDVFVEEKYILPQRGGLRVRPFEALPDTATFVAELDGQVVGVQSLVVDSPELGLPSDEAFKEELDALRGPGRVLCEASNEAVVEAFRRTPVSTELMRCLFAQAMAVGCNELITTVSPGHAKFYELLGFEKISGVRSYSQELEDPVVVMRMCMDGLASRVANIRDENGDDEAFLKRYYLDENPYHQFVGPWSAMAQKAFLDPQDLYYLFVDRSGLLGECTPTQIEGIRRGWGDEVFFQVERFWSPAALVA
jgi:GNAT superfamily N-acetyltransferase